MERKKWFAAAFSFVMTNEGGFSNDVADRGGATNYGINKHTLSSWRGRTVTDLDVRALDITEAMAIISKNYWLPIRAESMPSFPLAAVSLDAAVLFGPKEATRNLQKALGHLNFPATVDGLMGAETLTGLSTFGDAVVIEKFMGELNDKILSIVKKDPTQKRFEKGWLSRISRYGRLTGKGIA